MLTFHSICDVFIDSWLSTWWGMCIKCEGIRVV